jgi:hypothetical protein
MQKSGIATTKRIANFTIISSLIVSSSFKNVSENANWDESTYSFSLKAMTNSFEFLEVKVLLVT